MSSALNHRRRSHKCYEKRVSAMNTLRRKALVKEHQPSFRERILMLMKRRLNRFKRMKSDSAK